MEFKNIKFKAGLPVVVKLLVNKPEEKKGKFGMFNEYTAEYEGEEYKFIASEGLSFSLSEYGKGDIVEILKVDDDGGKSHFEVTQLEEKDIKSTDVKKYPVPTAEYPDAKDWDVINAEKDHKIALTVALKIAVASMPVKDKLTDKDYEEIEVRMVKFNAIRSKYLEVTIQNHPEEKPKLPKLVQEQWDLFSAYLEENKDKVSLLNYETTRKWLDNLSDKVTNLKVMANFKKFKTLVEGAEYQTYHEELIAECGKLVKNIDKDGVIALLDQIVFNWHIPELEKLVQVSENQCLNLLEEFEKIHGLPF